jgi:hypothetical protein
MIRQPNGYEIPMRLNSLLNDVVTKKSLGAATWLLEFPIEDLPFPYDDQKLSAALHLLGASEHAEAAALPLIALARKYMAHELILIDSHGDKKSRPWREIGAVLQASQRFLQAVRQLSPEAYSLLDRHQEGARNPTIKAINESYASCERLETNLADVRPSWNRAVLALRAPGGWSAESLPALDFPDEEARGAPKKLPRNIFIAGLAKLFERVVGNKTRGKYAFIRAAIEPFGFPQTIVTDAAIKGVLRRTRPARERNSGPK